MGCALLAGGLHHQRPALGIAYPGCLPPYPLAETRLGVSSGSVRTDNRKDRWLVFYFHRRCGHNASIPGVALGVGRHDPILDRLKIRRTGVLSDAGHRQTRLAGPDFLNAERGPIRQDLQPLVGSKVFRRTWRWVARI